MAKQYGVFLLTNALPLTLKRELFAAAEQERIPVKAALVAFLAGLGDDVALIRAVSIGRVNAAAYQADDEAAGAVRWGTHLPPEVLERLAGFAKLAGIRRGDVVRLLLQSRRDRIAEGVRKGLDKMVRGAA